ncbi:PASTA domain-containing protein [Actinomycetospora succinea]|uniref:PASTA domain-containing protein n=2 Tax=Actinomycetospora TaxID=402649 RepID=A0A4R6VHC1_9PSEU|nr:PASTA domain-containing protein [Actinomycetospora succinea]
MSWLPSLPMRTPELVLVPALVGLPAAQAHEVAMAARVVAVDPDPDTPPTVEGTVTAQQPEPGTRVPAGEAVTIWVEPDSGGGGGGGGNMPRIEPDKPLDGAGAN